jgi:ubiquinone/menaquinone biosynthesis C-methylase UbiE
MVARGYDHVAERYAAWVRDDVLDTVVPRYLGQLIELLPAGGTVLDLAVWGGGDRLAHLARHFTTTGVDISPQQVRHAQRAVPDARVVQGDMTRLDFPPASFDAVTAFYLAGRGRWAADEQEAIVVVHDEAELLGHA